MRMYQVGEYIVHPGQGVCRVEGVSEGEGATYKLLPIGQRHAMHISFPVASEDRLRPVLTPDEAREVIDQYPSLDLDDFTERNNFLEEEHFKQQIRNGSCLETVRVVKTFRARIAQAEASNKKPPVAYERILKQASERSLEELSCALECTTDDVIALFEQVGADEVSNN
jgi:RNA polymerase-interacting CarD/CdnL/TRCF family regulator